MSGFPAVRRMIWAARGAQEAQRSRCESLLARSNAALAPLRDPLRDDEVGPDRLLAGHREEIWSDWLAWVLARVGTPEQVAQVLGLEDSLPPAAGSWPKARTKRELPTPKGHEDSSGRLDVVVEFGGEGVILVEVKMCDVGPDGSWTDTAKHKGYLEWLDARPAGWKQSVLLALDGDDGCMHKRAWRDVAISLRALIPQLEAMTAALALAFAGAIERNLLWLRRPADVADYLEQALEAIHARST